MKELQQLKQEKSEVSVVKPIKKELKSSSPTIANTMLVAALPSCHKIIFLDMDGVIATPKSLDGGMWGITKECQELLGLILQRTNAELVISSSWRYATVEKTKEHFASKGFAYCDKIVGVTVRGYHHIEKGFPMSIPRGVEIKQWIDNNIHRDNGKGAFVRKKLGEDYRYVILDDDDDMLLEQAPYFVRCDSEIGLTVSKADYAVQILNGCL